LGLLTSAAKNKQKEAQANEEQPAQGPMEVQGSNRASQAPPEPSVGENIVG